MIYSVSLFQVPLTIRPNFDTIVWSDFFKSWIFSSGLHNGHWVWLVIFGTKKQWHKILEALMVPASGPSRVKSWLIDAVLIKSITLLGGSVRARIRASYFLYGSLPTPLCCSASPPPLQFLWGPLAYVYCSACHSVRVLYSPRTVKTCPCLCCERVVTSSPPLLHVCTVLEPHFGPSFCEERIRTEAFWYHVIFFWDPVQQLYKVVYA